MLLYRDDWGFEDECQTGKSLLFFSQFGKKITNIIDESQEPDFQDDLPDVDLLRVLVSLMFLTISVAHAFQPDSHGQLKMDPSHIPQPWQHSSSIPGLCMSPVNFVMPLSFM